MRIDRKTAQIVPPKLIRHLLPFLCLILVILVFLWRGATMQGLFFGADEIATDLLHHAYAYREYFARDYLKQGKLPLWNPYVGSGTPVLGEAQTGVFQPVAAFLYLFLPAAIAFNWLIIGTFIIIAIGTYIYALSIGQSRLSAFLVAIVFTFSGSMIGHLRHVPLITVVMTLPFLLLTTEQMIWRPRLYLIPLMAILIFCAFTPGQLATTYQLLFILGLYFLLRWYFFNKTHKHESLKPVWFFLGGVGIGIALSAVILIPALEMVKYSTRADLSLQSALTPEYKPQYLLMFLTPYVFGDPSRGSWDIGKESFWENIGYIGLIPLFLALLAVWWWRKERSGLVVSYLLLVVFCLLILLDSWTQLYHILRNWVPGFSFTRVPGRFLTYVDFFLSMLAGFGFTWLTERFLKKWKWGVILLIITVADLFYFGKNFNTVIPVSYYQPPVTVEFLRQDKSLYRIRAINPEISWYKAWSVSHGWQGDLSAYLTDRELVPPDSNLVYKLSSPAFVYGESGRFGLSRPNEFDSFTADTLDIVASRSATLFGLENVKYILSQSEVKDPEFKLVAHYPSKQSDVSTYIYKNSKLLPRAYLVGNVILKTGKQDIFNTMIASDFDPAQAVVVEKSIDLIPSNGRGLVNVDSYTDSQVDLTINTEKESMLVLSDTYYPGWQATIDNKPTEIYQANYVYRAIKVAAGKHKIIFKYNPISVTLGLIISGVSFIVWLTFSIYELIKYKWPRNGKLKYKLHQ